MVSRCFLGCFQTINIFVVHCPEWFFFKQNFIVSPDDFTFLLNSFHVFSQLLDFIFPHHRKTVVFEKGVEVAVHFLLHSEMWNLKQPNHSYLSLPKIFLSFCISTTCFIFMHSCINVLYLCIYIYAESQRPQLLVHLLTWKPAEWFCSGLYLTIMNVVINLFPETIPIHADINCVAINSFPVHVFFTSITLSCANGIQYFPYYHSEQICHIITYTTIIIMDWYTGM